MKLCWECGLKLYGNKYAIAKISDTHKVKTHIQCKNLAEKNLFWSYETNNPEEE